MKTSVTELLEQVAIAREYGVQMVKLHRNDLAVLVATAQLVHDLAGNWEKVDWQTVENVAAIVDDRFTDF